MQELPDWLRGFFDEFDFAAGVLNSDDTFLYANRAALAELRGKDSDLPCASFLDLVGDVRESGREEREAIIEALGFRWAGRIWPLGNQRIGFLGRRLERERSPVARLTKRHQLEAAEARLAFHIAQGRTNLQIGRLLGVTPGAIKQRALMLYRRLNVRNRVQLTALVVRCLSDNGFLD